MKLTWDYWRDLRPVLMTLRQSFGIFTCITSRKVCSRGKAKSGLSAQSGSRRIPEDFFKMPASLVIRAEMVKELNQCQVFFRQCRFHALTISQIQLYVKCIIPGKIGIMSLTNFSGGRDAALRRPRPAGRNERGKSSVFPSPDAAPGDGDSAARYPYLDSL